MNDIISSETNENFYEFELIKGQFEKWNTQFNETYRNAYISLSLPKLFSPLIRCELIDWNPLEKNANPNFLESSRWFKELLTYNREEIIKSLSKSDNDLTMGDDFLIIPHVIEKTVIGKITNLTANCYDPLSTSQTIKLTKLVGELVNNYSTVNYKSSNTKVILELTFFIFLYRNFKKVYL